MNIEHSTKQNAISTCASAEMDIAEAKVLVRSFDILGQHSYGGSNELAVR
jgi:hypothetical protein